jgi:hypothetical protein
MQALEYKLQEEQENVHVNCYTSFKFLKYSIPLQLSASGDDHCIVEPANGKVSLHNK